MGAGHDEPVEGWGVLYNHDKYNVSFIVVLVDAWYSTSAIESSSFKSIIVHLFMTFSVLSIVGRSIHPSAHREFHLKKRQYSLITYNIELFCHFDSQIDIRSLNFAMNVSCRK